MNSFSFKVRQYKTNFFETTIIITGNKCNYYNFKVFSRFVYWILKIISDTGEIELIIYQIHKNPITEEFI